MNNQLTIEHFECLDSWIRAGQLAAQEENSEQFVVRMKKENLFDQDNYYLVENNDGGILQGEDIVAIVQPDGSIERFD